MNVALLCIGLLGVLLVGLGTTVSLTRIGGSWSGSSDEPARVRFLKRQRAHGNAAEWIPAIMILTLATAWLWGARVWIEALWIGAVVARVSHATGMYAAPHPEKMHPLKYAGATMTYLFTMALALATVAGVLLRSSSIVSQ